MITADETVVYVSLARNCPSRRKVTCRGWSEKLPHFLRTP